MMRPLMICTTIAALGAVMLPQLANRYSSPKESDLTSAPMSVIAQAEIKKRMTIMGLQAGRLSPVGTSDINAYGYTSFEYLYRDPSRCISFKIDCQGDTCIDLQWYPYSDHGEACPIP